MATETAAGIGPRTGDWTPVRIFMLVAAIVHVPLGIIGLLSNQAFPVGARAAAAAGSERLFGILETNGWHSLAALGVGLIATYFTIVPRGARDAALMIGVLHVGIVASLAIWDPSTFWFASNGADQVVHMSTAIGGIGSALLTQPLRSSAATPIA